MNGGWHSSGSEGMQRARAKLAGCCAALLAALAIFGGGLRGLSGPPNINNSKQHEHDHDNDSRGGDRVVQERA